MKSESFPPYDPWFAGGYINYYYYGFVLAGTLVKLLGIVPTIAYNFILPTWFAMVATGAFTIAFNLLEGLRTQYDDENPSLGFQLNSLIAGVAASVMTVVGNLGTIQTIFNALQRIAAPGGTVPLDTTFVQKWIWAFQGISMMFDGATLPIGRGEWYWNASRLMPPGPGNEITEFPLFTFLYSDLHAHMLVIPLTLFIIAWAISFIKSHAQMDRGFSLSLLGVIHWREANHLSLYTFFPFAALAVLYAINRHFEWNGRFSLRWLGRLLLSCGGGWFVCGGFVDVFAVQCLVQPGI
jgi:uncharacterized membrane protein